MYRVDGSGREPRRQWQASLSLPQTFGVGTPLLGRRCEAHMAAWVRLVAPILRRMALTWTLMVASVIASLRAMSLLGSPFVKHPRISRSRTESLQASSSDRFDSDVRLSWN